MLNSGRKRENLAGKLLLSSALVAVSLAYGWWDRPAAHGPAMAMAPMPLPKALAPAAPPLAATSPAPEAQTGARDADTASLSPAQANAVAQPEKPAIVAKVEPQPVAPSVAPAPLPAQPQQDKVAAVPAPAPQPTPQSPPPADNTSPLEAMLTGTPEPGAKPAIPAGMHLEDGDYVSGKHEFMWGDLRIKIAVRGGVIAGMQALEYPDHRSQSAYLSQMAIPTLASEVIKKQTSQVDTVSSATDTSYVFQDAVADAVTKATRG
ncbi:MAG TPA: FMN-binding protein [Rhizomicrobium sp.]|jgi:uncharacterized protein with FMN-binding domain